MKGVTLVFRRFLGYKLPHLLPHLHSFLHFRPFSYRFQKSKQGVNHPSVLPSRLMQTNPRFQVLLLT